MSYPGQPGFPPMGMGAPMGMPGFQVSMQPGGMTMAMGIPPATMGMPTSAGFGYPPAQQDPLWVHFSAVAGADGQIDAEELQRCLTASGMADYPRPGGSFNLETCRLMVAMLDRDHSGTMGFNEFRELWAALNAWKTTFQGFDRDRSGTVEGKELGDAIRSYGYNVSPQCLSIITKRYSKRSTGQVSFDDFVALSIRLRAISARFRQRDQSGQGYATFYYDDFLQVAMAN